MTDAATGTATDGSSQTRPRRHSDGRDLRYPELPEGLTVAVYDNHTHLDITDGENALSLTEQLDRATQVGVAGVIQVGIDVASSRYGVWAAGQDPRVLAVVAIHPNEAPILAAGGQLDQALAEIDQLAANPRVRGIGESGLDYFRTEPDGVPAQLASFEAHIDMAKHHGKALQIHDREAHEDVLATLSRVGAPEKTVLHCFSGDVDFARRAVDAGFYLSFAGNITFKSAQDLRDALRTVPAERLLVETDAPFLTPMPYRGRPNAPYLIPLTMRAMAAERGEDLDALCAQIAANTVEVYGSFHDQAASPASEAGDF